MREWAFPTPFLQVYFPFTRSLLQLRLILHTFLNISLYANRERKSIMNVFCMNEIWINSLRLCFLFFVKYFTITTISLFYFPKKNDWSGKCVQMFFTNDLGCSHLPGFPKLSVATTPLHNSCRRRLRKKPTFITKCAFSLPPIHLLSKIFPKVSLWSPINRVLLEFFRHWPKPACAERLLMLSNDSSLVVLSFLVWQVKNESCCWDLIVRAMFWL